MKAAGARAGRIRDADLAGLVFAALGMAAAMIQLAFAFPSLGLPTRWLGQALVLALLWAALSVAPILMRAKGFGRLVFAVARFAVYELLAYPLGGAGGVCLALLCALVVEAVMVLSPPADLILPLLFLALALLRPRGATAWDLSLGAMSVPQALALVLPPLLLVVAFRLYRGALARSGEQRSLIERLKRSGLDLIDTNLVLQEKIIHQETRLLEVERSRISRELHDTIGYTLMNILAMQKAAGALMRKDPGRALEFIVKTMEQSERGLRDTRAAIGSLRGRTEREPTIAEVVTQLARAFENTHIRISADLNNSFPSYGPGVDEVLGRFVQEAITNAIKHGNADEIFINFWRAPEGVTVSVRDNGSGIPGAEPPPEGMGLKGMRERFGEIGGEVSLGNAYGGFRISAFVPALACSVEL